MQLFVGETKQTEVRWVHGKKQGRKIWARKLQQVYEDIKTMSDRSGFVYVAVHDAWPSFSKIGCTKDPIQRIKTYSTYDPVDCYVGCLQIS